MGLLTTDSRAQTAQVSNVLLPSNSAVTSYSLKVGQFSRHHLHVSQFTWAWLYMLHYHQSAIWMSSGNVTRLLHWLLGALCQWASYSICPMHGVCVLLGNEESTWLLDVLVYIAGTHNATNLVQASPQCLLERSRCTRTLTPWSAPLQLWPLLSCLRKDLMLRFTTSQLSLLGWATY